MRYQSKEQRGGQLILDRLAREVEALLFASDTPLSLEQLGEFTGSGTDSIRSALDMITDSFNEYQHALVIIEVAGGFRIATDNEFGPVVSQLFEGRRPGRLSKASLETLAVIAYMQPATRGGIEGIRGVNCDSSIRTLLERDMIKISGRKEAPGRPLLYSTTSSFLEYFGLSDIAHLPRSSEISELIELTPDELRERDLFASELDSDENS